MTFLRLFSRFRRGCYSLPTAAKKAARLTWRGY